MVNQEWTVSYEKYVQTLMAEDQIPGAAVGLAKDGQLIYGKGFGYRNVAEQREVTLDTVFGIGSITKSFTCMAIMQLQEAGKLSVHDPVIKYLPEFRLKPVIAVEQITIHHLMTHSAGLPPLPTLYPASKRSMDLDPEQEPIPESLSDLVNVKPIDTYADLFAYLSELDFVPLGPPGTQFSYSNDSYALLGIIVERVSGKTYETYVKEHLLRPAGMDRSLFFLEELSGDSNITSLYTSKEQDGKKEVCLSDNWWDAPAMRAAGFLNSTVRDMLKYADIYRSGGLAGKERILSEASVKQMTTPYIECQFGRFYGYGLMIVPDYHGSLLVEHGGSNKGIEAQMYVLPEQGITGVVLTNLDGAPAVPLMEGACNAYAGRPVDATHLSVSQLADPHYQFPIERAEEYTGEFQSGEGTQFSIKWEDSRFVMVTEDQAVPLRPVGEDLFMFKRKGTETFLRFIRDSEHNVVRVRAGFRQIPKVAKA